MNQQNKSHVIISTLQYSLNEIQYRKYDESFLVVKESARSVYSFYRQNCAIYNHKESMAPYTITECYKECKSQIDEAHFWLNGYVNKQNCRIWNEANPQVYVETPLHPEKLTVWCALWPRGILLQKR
ncbi:hypothetical protein TNCV_3529461 [Trichonephila clavipes]|uniref:Uncharacterized protein n=1 Tax=Trichonephila clavipes TaxID=2585209 RepID=A0A8X6RFR8_TRICX|nr:hypothetical protein TNCV_3529461 [Trichonephila clavipes]